jgi:hypothetical protein
MKYSLKTTTLFRKLFFENLIHCRQIKTIFQIETQKKGVKKYLVFLLDIPKKK